MATIAFDSSGAHDAYRPPISLHPAFPAVVALWFAALLGLGSLVLPLVLLERVVDATGIAALVPAASPPLGFMARGLIALASAIAGAIIGVAVARRVASAHNSERPSRATKFASGARRPISVHEELGGEGLVNGFGLPVNRRRALAIAEDDRPSDFLYMAPLPGNDEDDHPLPFEAPVVAHKGSDEPLELRDRVDDFAEGDAPAPYDEPDAAADDESEPMSFKQEFRPTSPVPQAGLKRQVFGIGASRTDADALPFSAPSLARRAALAETRATEPEAAPHQPEYAEPEPVDDDWSSAAVMPEPEPVRSDWATAPTGELGLVQLVQRLGASLERRRERLAVAAVAAPAHPLAPAAGFEPAPAEEAVQAMAAYFGKPNGAAPDATFGEEAGGDEQPAPFAPAESMPRPNLLRSWHAADNEDDLGAMPSFTLPLRKSVSPTIAFDDPRESAADDGTEIEDDVADDSFSSLLAMRNPFASKDEGFVRIEEPEPEADAVEPAVVFPGRGETAFASQDAGGAVPRPFDPPGEFGAAPQAGPQTAPAGTDAALRAALATLQRMSGTV